MPVQRDRKRSQPTFILSGVCAALLLSACQTFDPVLSQNPLQTLAQNNSPPPGRLHCPPGNPACRPQQFNLPQQNRFYLPPEYMPTQAVIVSDRVMADSNGLPLLQALIQAQSDVWMLGTDANLAKQTEQALQFTLSPLGIFPLAQKFVALPLATDSVWSRDYGPLATLPTPEYSGPKLDYKLLNSFYYPDRRQDDRVPASLSRILNSPLGPLTEKTVFTSQLSLALEGGNLMCTQALCFSSRSVVERNLGQVFRNSRPLNNESDIINEFASQLSQQSVFVNALPGEATGHIDMWAKFLDEKTLLVHQLSDATIQQLPVLEQTQARVIQAFLDEQATGQDASGQEMPESLAQKAKTAIPDLKILRLPMPAPMLYQGNLLVRSYTNSLLVNGTALLPQYKNLPANGIYPDAERLNAYEQAVAQVYQSAGYQVKWIPSDSWIVSGGAVHCVTMQVPKTAM
ncbi:MAG: agmatine deiminase family protein [Candidatus Sericytochromatia bacterium]|nr:agmatine deiminase family protein [Candidatus Sericytochromatia bacterium]